MSELHRKTTQQIYETTEFFSIKNLIVQTEYLDSTFIDLCKVPCCYNITLFWRSMPYFLVWACLLCAAWRSCFYLKEEGCQRTSQRHCTSVSLLLFCCFFLNIPMSSAHVYFYSEWKFPFTVSRAPHNFRA